MKLYNTNIEIIRIYINEPLLEKNKNNQNPLKANNSKKRPEKKYPNLLY